MLNLISIGDHTYICVSIPCYSRSKLVSSPLAEKEEGPPKLISSLTLLDGRSAQAGEADLSCTAQARISTPARGWNVRALLCIPCGALTLYRHHHLPSISSLWPSLSSWPLVIIIMAIIIIVCTSLPCGALILHWAALLANLAGHNTPAHVHIPLVPIYQSPGSTSATTRLANPRLDETRAMNFERSLTLGMEEVLASRGMRPKPAPSPGIFPGEVFRVGAALPCLASSFVPSMHFVHPSGPEDDPSKKVKKSNIIRWNFRAWVREWRECRKTKLSGRNFS